MKDENFRLLVIVIVVFLIVSLLMNSLLAADPGLVKGPPVRIYGYIAVDGTPIDGYYFAGQAGTPAAGQPPGMITFSTRPVP
jgi:hypothetical protein